MATGSSGVTDSYRHLELAYGADLERLGPLRQAFVRLALDEDTRAWIDDAIAHPHSEWMLKAKVVARQVLSDYDANGLVGVHDMRVLGAAQWRQLLGGAGGALLDVGAGEGQVTDALAPLHARVETTEMSAMMARKLRARGYPCHRVDLASEALPGEPRQFDTVAMLNVVDRTHRPLALVAAARDLLAPRGRLVVTVPLPLRPHVHVGARTVDPEEILPRDERGFEEGVRALADGLFAPLGLAVERVSRAPYLCRGGAAEPVLVLDDAIFVCRRRGQLLYPV